MTDDIIKLAISVIGITQCIKNIIGDGNILLWHKKTSWVCAYLCWCSKANCSYS